MFKQLKNFFKRRTFRFVEGRDFKLVADLQALKDNEPNPWSIQFLGRVVKVHSIKIPEKESSDGHFHVEINSTIVDGPVFEFVESQQFGDLLLELVERNFIAKDK